MMSSQHKHTPVERNAFAPLQSSIYCFDVLYDEQIDPDEWARWLASQSITHVEFHSYMRGHELADTPGKTWNSHAGDARLWTSQRILERKVEALHTWGIHAILYAACYAASPEFFAKYPNWAAYYADSRPVFFPDILPPYLVIQAMNCNADFPYEINGVVYHNFRAYITRQLQEALAHYRFDGVRMDFYGMPSNYTSPCFSGISNMSDDLVDFIAELNVTLKQSKPDTEVLVIELPNVDGDRIRQGIADHIDAHWLELWSQPHATGPSYDDLIREIHITRALSPQKGIVASIYPQNPPETNYPFLAKGWSAINIEYNYATVFAAGATWGGQSVDGYASFTQVLPFKFSYMDRVRVELTRQWNQFTRCYGPYYSYGSEFYSFTEGSTPHIEQLPEERDIHALLYSRTDCGDDVQDALLLHLIQYGVNRLWSMSANVPETLCDLKIRVPLDSEQTVYRVLALDTVEQPLMLIFEQKLGELSFMLPSLKLYKLIVIELVPDSTLPPLLPKAPTAEYQTPEPFDIGGNTIWGNSQAIPLMDQTPWIAISPFQQVEGNRAVQAHYVLTDEEGYSSGSSYRIEHGHVKFTGTRENAIRFNLNNFPHFIFAWKASQASEMIVTLEVIDMDTHEVHNLTYGVGQATADYPLGAMPLDWMLVERDILQDVQNTTWGESWQHIAVTALIIGTDGTAYFDAFQFNRIRDWHALHVAAVKSDNRSAEIIRDGKIVSWCTDHATQDTIWIDLGSSQFVGKIEIHGAFDEQPIFHVSVGNDPVLCAQSTTMESQSNAYGTSLVLPNSVNGRYVHLSVNRLPVLPAEFEVAIFTR